MQKNTLNNLTEGPIYKSLMQLAMPIMASSFLSTAYNIMDMAWIGTLGASAVAGVGVGGMYVWLSQGLANLARMGGQVYAAQSIGENNRENAGQYSKAALHMVILFALIFSGLCLVFTDPLVSFFQITDEQTLASAHIYLRITCGFIIFPYLNTTLTGLYTAQGDSKTPLLANLVGLMTNMVLDPLLILGIGPFSRLEAAGAAIATVLSQAIVLFILVLHLSFTSDAINVLKNTRLIRPAAWVFYTSIFKLGLPAALQSSLYCFFSIILTRMVAAFGAEAVAVQRVGGQIESICWNTAEGFASALNAFCAQNFGARQMKRVKKGFQLSFYTIAAWGAMVTLVFILLPHPISSIFFHEETALGVSVDYLRIIGVGEAFMSIEILTIGALSGLGLTSLCSIISILLTGSRIPLALLLSKTGLGLNGIWWALTITSIIKGVVFYLTFHKKSTELEQKM